MSGIRVGFSHKSSPDESVKRSRHIKIGISQNLDIVDVQRGSVSRAVGAHERVSETEGLDCLVDHKPKQPSEDRHCYMLQHTTKEQLFVRVLEGGRLWVNGICQIEKTSLGKLTLSRNLPARSPRSVHPSLTGSTSGYSRLRNVLL